MPTVKAVVTAGGTSRRYGSTNKLFEDLCGKPVIKYSVDLFTEMGFEIVIPCHSSFQEETAELFKDYKNVKVIQGGDSRQQSVFKGLKAVGDCDFVIIHDAARPLIQEKTVKRCLETAFEKKAVITAVKTTDTIKTVDETNKITSTPNRANLINVQTPQIFEYRKILEAHEKFQNENFTDDACLIEACGGTVYYSDGEYSNIKITNHSDTAYAKILLETELCF